MWNPKILIAKINPLSSSSTEFPHRYCKPLQRALAMMTLDSSKEFLNPRMTTPLFSLDYHASS